MARRPSASLTSFRRQLIARSDFVVDVHSGDGAEWLHPFIGVYGGPLASDYPSALAFAKAFGIPALIRYQMKTQAQIDSGRSLNRQGVAAGKPTILVEIGQNGGRDSGHVAIIVACGLQTFKGRYAGIGHAAAIGRRHYSR